MAPRLVWNALRHLFVGLAPGDDVNLTPHFTVDELVRTSTGLPNTPTAEHLDALRCLCAAVLEPWRERTGPLRVTSGYRSRAVNDELRRRGYSASSTSQHMLGEAADVQPATMALEAAWAELLDAVEAGLPVDQAIVYQRKAGVGWVHVSHTCTRPPRKELLVQLADGKTYVPWSWWTGALVLP